MVNVKLATTLFLFSILPYTSFAQVFGGNSPLVKWKQINAPKAKIIFPANLDSQANRIANVIQLLDSSTSQTIGGSQRKWNIVLQNQTIIPNAYVRMAPILSELYMVPGQDNFSTGSIRWDDNLIIHENRHMQQFSNFNKGFTKWFSFLLGQEGQLFANGLMIPDYFFEGDAVWQETLVSSQGRGRLPAFFNGYKSLWLENKKYKWNKLRAGSLKDFVPDIYPLGYILIGYGNEKYGAEFWKKVTEDAVRFKRLFTTSIEKNSGLSFTNFRDSAFAYFKKQSLNDNNIVDDLSFHSKPPKNNVINYYSPYFIGNDSIIVQKQTLTKVPAFYLIANGKEEKIRIKNFSIDDYFSYTNGKIVYASYQSDARWGNRNYSVLQVLDIKTKKQHQITFKSKYFSPDINTTGTEVLSVKVNTNGTNYLVKLDVATGKELVQIPNVNNYFFTQTKYIDSNRAVSAIRNAEGKMTLVIVHLSSGAIEPLIPFSYNVLGYPFVKGDTIYFNYMNENSDKIFAISLSSRQSFQITKNTNGVYQPTINNKGEILYAAFSASGSKLVKKQLQTFNFIPFSFSENNSIKNLYTPSALLGKSSKVLDELNIKKYSVSEYKKRFQFFNFHSWRPIIADPEFGYNVYSDNSLSNFNNIINYTFNRNDKSHTVGFNTTYAGFFPILNIGVEETFNRKIDTAIGKSVTYNTAALKAGFSIPLSFIGGRTSKYINIGAGYNIEQYYYNGLSKNVFSNKAINYINSFFGFSIISLQAKQNINPRWAQTFLFSYKDAFTFRNSYKFIGSASFYFPGISVNHSLVFNTVFQKRDSLPDLFSNTFLYARGYQAISTRQMYKLGVNYHFPLFYPDWGIGGLIFFQRLRANTFFDYNNATARLNGQLTQIKNRSTGVELYFDTKIWSALPVSFGFRFSHLLDKDLINPTVKNKWELIIPFINNN